MNNSQKVLRELTLEECEKISGGNRTIVNPGPFPRPYPRPGYPRPRFPRPVIIW